MTHKKDYIWAFIGYISEAGVYAILTPVMAAFLKSTELGLWYTFMSIYMFTNVIDAGFSPIITRNAAYCMGGAEILVKEGVPPMNKDGTPNFTLLGRLFKMNRKMISIFSFIGLFFLLTIGSIYVNYITRNEFDVMFMVAWWIFACAVAINLYVISIPAFLRGVGAIAEAQQIMTLARLTQLVVCTLAVISGFGLIGLSIGFLFSASLIGILSYMYYYKNIRIKILAHQDDDGMNIRDLFKTTWYNSSKLLINSCGSYMIIQANTLLCSAFISLEMTATYSLTLQIMQAIAMIGSVIMQINVPAISVANVSNDFKKRDRLFSGSMVIYWLICGAGTVMVMFFGSPVLKLLGGKTLLLNFPLIFIVGIENFLEKNCANHNQMIISENKIPFLKSTLLSGFMIILLSYLCLSFTNFGLFGIIIIQGTIQGCYNYWYWPLLVKRKLRLSLKNIIIKGFAFIREDLLHV